MIEEQRAEEEGLRQEQEEVQRRKQEEPDDALKIAELKKQELERSRQSLDEMPSVEDCA